ncbi:hypothetical protein ELS19_17135 [Halogeometricum borinquense]|uniref:Helix-turn-helix domain-containing protein n=1 Tax=Halogeometricum borinquense TaxID=60847 RepID=A0A482T205_9EURY|nr:hypothetical protein [Halogeometricum borinquense]RYJ08720.1 hypothetical protein ELS19_17135 [Halogeometricum borinquense]
MSEQQHTLEDLLVDEDELNEELLYNLLADYVRIGNDSGSIILQPNFKELNSREKVAVILLAQHAKVELGKSDKRWLTPSEISQISGIKKGTVYPTARKLEEDGVAENDDGSYSIPVYNLETIKSYIGGGDE